jgi:amino acid permease
MNIYSLKDGVILGLTAMTGVFLVLAVIGLILYSFELIFYRKKKQVAAQPQGTVITEKGIPKKVVAAISAAVFSYLQKNNIKNPTIKIKKHKQINKTYEKLRAKRWKNG